MKFSRAAFAGTFVALSMFAQADKPHRIITGPLSTDCTVTGIGTSEGKITCPMSIFTVSDSPPQPEWVPDPSAGHYDCPDGWIAVVPSEPPKYSPPLLFVPARAVHIEAKPNLDKKGHVLGERPKSPICVQESQPHP